MRFLSSIKLAFVRDERVDFDAWDQIAVSWMVAKKCN